MKIDPNQLVSPVEHAGFYAHGLPIRAHFAAMAMQGILSNPEMVERIASGSRELGQTPSQFVSKCAIQHADALIAALNKEGK